MTKRHALVIIEANVPSASAVMMDKTPALTSVLDAHPNAFILIDRDYNIVAANRKYFERYQHSGHASPIGRKCYEVSHRADRPCWRSGEDCPHQQVFGTGQPHEVVHRHYDGQGAVQYVRIAAHPIFDEQGALLYISESMHTCARPEELAGNPETAEMVGRSPTFNHIVGHLCAAAESDAPILLTGETGSGKELAARLIHRKSPRAARPFVPLDCTVLTQELCADELFGHEKGAFTGCAGAKPGLFDLAHRGTLFLDEIGDMPLAIQAKLLRVLETGTYRRVGGTELQKVDVRLICATNRDLRQMVAEGRFRADLYYRIACVHLELPPLRHRREDIPELARYFLSQRAPGQGITPAAMALLDAYDYPGNVRELANIIDRARILARGAEIDVVHLPVELQKPAAARMRRNPIAARTGRGDPDSIRDALIRFGGNRRRAASWLGLSERTLYRRLRQLQADA